MIRYYQKRLPIGLFGFSESAHFCGLYFLYEQNQDSKGKTMKYRNLVNDPIEGNFIAEKGVLGTYVTTVSKQVDIKYELPYMVYQLNMVAELMSAEEQRKILIAADRITKHRFNIEVPMTEKMKEKEIIKNRNRNKKYMAQSEFFE